jgi:hypothetical protein
VIINREPTPLDGIADAVIRDGIGTVIAQIERLLETVSKHPSA